MYIYPLYRPPAEANNIILQVTYGCSYNNCTFCSMYKDKKFKKRAIEDIYKDIDILSSSYPNATKVFLADGDAMMLNTNYLLKLLTYLQTSFKKLRRVSLYASTQNILLKTKDELDLLYQHNLKLIYFGIEIGDDTILTKINKGVSQKDIINSLNLVIKSNIKISATIILGLGGKNYTKEHTLNSAYIVNHTAINYLSTLQLGLEDVIKDKFCSKFTDFIELDDTQILQEQQRFIEQLNPKNKVIFRSNHASNALHLSGTLPKDKDRLISEIETALNLGKDSFVPLEFRGF